MCVCFYLYFPDIYSAQNLTMNRLIMRFKNNKTSDDKKVKINIKIAKQKTKILIK